MNTAYVYTILIVLTAIERLIEVKVSNRNAKWSLEQGGTEYGRSHYPFMVVLHTVFLFACVGEVFYFEREVGTLWLVLFTGLALGCQELRWWCINTLGQRWNTRVIIVPNLPRVTGGPYRYVNHPNYVVVALEGIILPLVHQAWLTAICFTILNAGLMLVRIRCENEALSKLLSSEVSHD